MKLNSINNEYKSAVSFRSKTPAPDKIASFFLKSNDLGEGLNIACDFLGKAAVVPAVIMVTSKEPKEQKEYSALKNPVAAFIQLALEVPILDFGSKIVEKQANKGFFDVKNSDFSYNVKAKKDDFTAILKSYAQDSKIANEVKSLLKNIEENGYSEKFAKEFSKFIKSTDENSFLDLKSAFKTLEETHKHQFHLENRICFLASIILTPLLCALENKIHPYIMDKFFKKTDNKSASLQKVITMDEFIQNTKISRGQDGN